MSRLESFSGCHLGTVRNSLGRPRGIRECSSDAEWLSKCRRRNNSSYVLSLRCVLEKVAAEKGELEGLADCGENAENQLCFGRVKKS